METVCCACKKCSRYVGKFPNLWVRIGKSHFAPVNESPETESLQIQEKIRNGANNTLLAGSFLQNLTCKGCNETLGIRCEDAPAGHVLKKDQLILRLGGMTMVSDVSGKRIRPNFQDSISLERAIADKYTDQMDKPASLDATRESLLAPGFSCCPGDTEPDSTIDHFTEWAEAVKILRNDMDRISEAVARVDDDMKSVKELLIVIRKELITKSNVTAVTALHEDINHLAREMGFFRHKSKDLQSVDSRLRIGVDEVDAITDSASLMGEKANEVDSLKMEVQSIKARIKRLEEESRLPTAASENEKAFHHANPIVKLAQDAVLRLDDTIASQSQETASQGKRKSIQTPERSSYPKRSRQSELLFNTTMSHKISGLSKAALVTDSATATATPNVTELRDITDVGSTSEDELLLPNPTAYSTVPARRTRRTVVPQPPHSVSTASPRCPLISSSSTTDSSHTAPLVVSTSSARLKSPPMARRRGKRRGKSETLRNSEGVRLTKKGLPDKRAGNYQYLKAYYEGRGKGKRGVARSEVDGVVDGEGQSRWQEAEEEEEEEEDDDDEDEDEEGRKETIRERERAVVASLKWMEREENEE